MSEVWTSEKPCKLEAFKKLQTIKDDVNYLMESRSLPVNKKGIEKLIELSKSMKQQLEILKEGL